VNANSKFQVRFNVLRVLPRTGKAVKQQVLKKQLGVSGIFSWLHGGVVVCLVIFRELWHIDRIGMMATSVSYSS
jgi:hypothetical protein